MRFLDRNKIPYEYQTYECDEFIDGISVADKSDFLTNRFIKLSSQSEKAVDIMSLSFRLRQNWI